MSVRYIVTQHFFRLKIWLKDHLHLLQQIQMKYLNFLSFTSKELSNILKNEYLEIEVVDVFKSLQRWAESKVSGKKLNTILGVT